MNGRAIITIIVVGVALIAGGIVIALLGTPLIFPDQASAEAEQIDDLFQIMLAIGGAIFLLVQGVLLWVVIRHRAQPGDLSDGPPLHGNNTLEITWTVIPAIIVTVIAILSYQVWTDLRATQENEQVVQVVGQRFQWTFIYDIPTSMQVEDGPTTFTSPKLNTYVGDPELVTVKLEMTTPDVLHSFWVPAMRIKQDLLPGRETDVRFTPNEAGEFDVVCAELCGAGHGGMTASVVVHEDEAAFNAWFEERVEEIKSGCVDPVECGRQILSAGGLPCASCHTHEGLDGWTGQVGPDLTGLGERAARRVAGLTAEEYLAESIRMPDAFVVSGFGNLMPAFAEFAETDFTDNQISAEELGYVTAFLLAEGEE